MSQQTEGASWQQALTTFQTLVASGRTTLEASMRPVMRVMSSSPSHSTISKLTSSSDITVQHQPLPASHLATPDAVVRMMATRCMYLSLVSNEAQREAAALWNYAEQRKVIVPSYRDAHATTSFAASERTALPIIRRLITEKQWEMACTWVHKTAIGDAGLAAGVEAYSAGSQWVQATLLFATMSQGSRSDRELACILGAMFRVSRHHARILQSSRRHATEAVDPEVTAETLWRSALGMTQSYMRDKEGTVAFSSCGAINNLFGILGALDRWKEALQVAVHVVEGIEPHMGSSDAKVSINAVGLTQLCYALRSHWFSALTVATRLVTSSSLGVASWDNIAMQRVLNVCLSGDRWAEATHLLSTWNHGGTHVPLPSELCIKLLELLGSRRHASQAGIAVLMNDHLARSTNPNVRARAWNSMIQNANSTPEADMWRDKISEQGLQLENESIAKIVQLCAHEGQWERSIHMCRELMYDRRHRGVGSYLPSSALHDWVQYAIQRSPAPGPSWEVSVALFSQMADAHVALSDTAFRAVVQRCFSQGAVPQANALFAFMMKRGVGRR